MNKEEKINFINSILLNRDNSHANYIFKEAYFKKTYPTIYDEMLLIEFPEHFKFSQKLWHFLHDDFDFEKKCNCPLHGQLKFVRFTTGYRQFCKPHCDEYNKIVVQKSKNTRIKNCGSVEESYKKGMEKNKETCLERHGVTNGGGIPESIEKIKNTKIKNFGSIENLNEHNKLKSYETRIKNCGSVEESYRLASEKTKETLKNKSDDYYVEITKKIKKTKKERYNDENYVNHEKYVLTCQERYNTDNFSKTDEFKEKNKISTNNRTINKYEEILYIKDDTYYCKCIDNNCTLCDKKLFDIKYSTFYNRKFYNIDICTIRTPEKECSNISGEEKGLLSFIKSVYSDEIVVNDRKILKGKELDIYLPKLNIAFEFNGIYWHNEFNKNKKYHQNKSLMCLDNGIQLIHIWEDDWLYRNDIIKDIIKTKLNLNKINIGARKCIIKEISNYDSYNFLNNYHIQGGVKNGISIGLYYNDELVEVIVFGNLRKFISGNNKDNYYEIYRVCSKSGYNIQGGFSKLLKYIEKNYNPKCIITYANLDYSIGNVYMSCGFVKKTISQPTYTWVVKGKRKHRSNFMKSKLDECKQNPKLTEVKVMHDRGCWRCWDSGKIKFEKTY